MQKLYIFLCFTVYIACASDIYDPLSWYDEVDFDTLFEERNEADIPKDMVSSEEFVNNDNDKELKPQNELGSNVVDEYGDDYQIEDNRSEVKDDVLLDRKEEDTPNEDDLLKKLNDDIKELSGKSESQEAADDFDDFKKSIKDDTSLENIFKQLFPENDGDILDLSDLFSDENKLEDDVFEPLPLPPLNEDINEEINQSQNNEKEDSIKSLEQEEVLGKDLQSDMQEIFEKTKKILEETSDKSGELNKDANDQVSAEAELNKDNIEKENIPNDGVDENNIEEDSVAQVYKDLNDDLDKLLETMNKLAHDDFSEEQNPDDAFDVDPLNLPESGEDLEILHDDQRDQFDYDDDTQDYKLKLDKKELLKNKDDAPPYIYENDALEAADNDRNTDVDNVDTKSENEFDESNPSFHPADSKKDNDDFNSADSENEFDEANPNFHPADSKKDDDQFKTTFNSVDSENEFDESNPNFHPADSKKDNIQFDTDFNLVVSENEVNESNPDFHPADSKKSNEDLSDELGFVVNDFESVGFEEVKEENSELPVQKVANNIENVKEIANEDINSSDVLQEARENQDEGSQIDDKDQDKTPEKKITKNVEDLTSFELEQLTRQFVMLHKNELSMDSDFETNAEHVKLNAYESVVITSPDYPSFYPTTGDSPIDWILDGEGHGIELNITDLDLNSVMGHYLLIKPGDVDASGSDGIVFAFHLNEPKKYRFRNVDRMFVRFECRSGQPRRGFSMSVKMIEPPSSGDDEEMPEPEPVVPAPQAIMTLLLGGLNATEFEKIREEFRRLLADMAVMYINANGIDPGNNSTHFTTQITRTYICKLNWPGFESCVEVRFSIPLVYDEDQEDHRLNENDLVAMWYSYVGQDPFALRLRNLGIAEYTMPNESSVMMIWVVIAAGVLISMVMLACTLWRFSCFDGYTRHYTPADDDSMYNEKRGLDMYPTPHQTLPPLYTENEYKWDDSNFADTKVDMGGFTNRNYVSGELSDESEEEVVASRDRFTTDV